ncbi:hypothetical protein EOI86_21075 [Hwanghaeella grinnelliae]|uniref:Porin n=1 Tax=Hwanghaeella grinnelliae TaxID=2500179 RepID=A0A437QGM1_9PROT|nr:porin [Hwanghaeella grinnelliae]RVU33652.1 hypothetical protein EOI86_21075 [Hwanghaeella grinnelliae]
MKRGTIKWRLLAAVAVGGAGLGGLVATSGIAQAEEQSYPSFSGSIEFEIQNDYGFDSDDPNEERNELGGSVSPDLYFHATEHVYLNAGLVFESVRDPDPAGDDRYFDDHGLYVEVLTLNAEFDGLHVYGGKFGPNFSIAYDAASGIYGTEISEDDIQLSEFVGAGAAYTFAETPVGSVTTSASVFTQDTSYLADATITHRDRTREADGGPGNTGNLQSYAIAVDGEGLPVPGDLRYHLGYAHLASDDTDDEQRFAIAAEWGFAAGGMNFTPLLEYVHFEDAGGVTGADRDYVTGSLLAEYEAWNVALAYTHRDVGAATGVAASDDYQVQLSAGYAFENGIGIDVGVKENRTEGVNTRTVGALLSYGYEF